MTKLSIIIPVYNEKDTILTVIKNIESVTLPSQVFKEIIIVDDGSTDGTVQILESLQDRPHIRIILQSENQGKTSAVRVGLSKATGDIVLIQDADLEYSPSHYPELLTPILKGKANIVYGSRFKGNIQNMTFINRMANIISNRTINLFYNSNITDLHCGFKVFQKDIIDQIPITTDHFTIDTEITVRALAKGLTIVEVPIDYVARSQKEGKKINWRLALASYFFLLQFKLGNKAS